jgi:hypothetical protein
MMVLKIFLSLKSWANQNSGWVGLISGALLLMLLGFWKVIKNSVARAANYIKSKIGRRTMSFVSKPNGSFWHMGAMGEDKKPAMQVHSEWYLTNNTHNRNITVTKAIFTKNGQEFRPLLVCQNKVIGDVLPPDRTVGLDLSFFVPEPFCKIGETFKASFIVFDQYNTAHKLPTIIIRYQ